MNPLAQQKEKQKQSHSKRSSQKYFDEKGFRLYQGDCLAVLSQIPEESTDVIFADPPYHLSNGGFTVHAGKRVSVNKGSWDESKGTQKDFLFHQAWIQACYRVLKPGGTIWVSGTYHSIYACGLALQIAGYKILNDIAWYKPNAAPNLSGRYFTASHETILWARKGEKSKHTFNYKEMRTGPWHLNDSLKNEGKQMRSVWAIGAPRIEEKKFGKHPTQKPMALLERIVLASSNKRDLILDPFTGSSTTGLSAVKHGRKFVGIDTEKKYLNLSIKRFKDMAQ